MNYLYLYLGMIVITMVIAFFINKHTQDIEYKLPITIAFVLSVIWPISWLAGLYILIKDLGIFKIIDNWYLLNKEQLKKNTQAKELL